MKEQENSPFALDKRLSVYGIRRNPFPIDETDDFFFSTANLDKQLNALRSLAEYGDLILIISGVEGSGKTTLLNQLLRSADARWKCCRIDGDPSMSIKSLLDALLCGFGAKGKGDDTVSDEGLLRSYLARAHAREHVTLLVVDDAHLMPQACIEFLVTLAEQRDDMELRLLLTTQPGRLGISSDDPKRIHVVALKPFDAQQCSDYLNTRLSHAGLVGDSPFGESVVEAIHQDSGGIPGEIHPAAVRTLLANAKPSGLRRHLPFSGRMPAYVALALVIAGAVAFMIRSQPDGDTAAIRDPGATGKIKGRLVAGNASREMASEKAVTTRTRATASPQPLLTADTRTATMSVPELSSEQAAAGGDDDVKVFTLQDEPAGTIAAVAVTSPAPLKGGMAASGDDAVLSLAKNVTPAAAAATPSAPAATAAVPATAAISTASTAVTSAAATGAADAAADPPRAAHDLDWLRRQDPSHFVIQLVGTRDAAAARKFIQQHALADRGAWITTSFQNAPWYVVVYGTYPDSASARAAIAALPERLRAASPWPRSVASLVESAR